MLHPPCRSAGWSCCWWRRARKEGGANKAGVQDGWHDELQGSGACKCARSRDPNRCYGMYDTHIPSVINERLFFFFSSSSSFLKRRCVTFRDFHTSKKEIDSEGLLVLLDSTLGYLVYIYTNTDMSCCIRNAQWPKRVQATHIYYLGPNLGSHETTTASPQAGINQARSGPGSQRSSVQPTSEHQNGPQQKRWLPFWESVFGSYIYNMAPLHHIAHEAK